MATILITRPRAASESLARELETCGYETVIEPLLVIEPLKTPQPDISDIHAVMVTSGNALDAMAGQGLNRFFDLPCFCVGGRTAAKARDFGFRDVHSSEGDGIELARLIQKNISEKNMSILHICGRDVNSNARDELTQSGYRIVGWPVYAAHPVAELTGRTADLFCRRQLDAILVFSARSAETLSKLIIRHGLEACCEAVIAIGLSEAVTDVLKPLPWKERLVPPCPTENALIECLKQIHPAACKVP